MDISSPRPVRRSAVARPRLSAYTVAALAFSGIALLIRLYRLGAQSLWLDEGGTWAEITHRGWVALTTDLWSRNAAYPLYHLLLKVWVSLAGDAEWSLRFPSALAGAGAIMVTMLAAQRLAAKTIHIPFAAGLLIAISPFAIWHSQDAKAYSFVILIVALMLWSALRALHTEHKRDWWQLAVIALVALFIHRLTLLPVAALAFTLALIWPFGEWFKRPVVAQSARIALGALGIAGAVAGVVGLARAIGGNDFQSAGHIEAGPLQSIWLSLSHFVADRGDINGMFGLPLVVWALPALLLTLWGLVLLARDIVRGNRLAAVVCSLFLMPLVLLALAQVFTPVYEARYATVAFPAWVLVAAYPLVAQNRVSLIASTALTIATLVIGVGVLFQPEHGLFSGAPVKEQWREGVEAIAHEMQPDDLLILHPYYTKPMWDYYAPRVTADSLPAPTVFSDFGQGSCIDQFAHQQEKIRICYQRTYEQPFNQAAKGKKRALLLIAPGHAATIDPPKTLAELQDDFNAGLIKDPPTLADSYGWVGLRFDFAKEERTWPCGGLVFVGVETKCVSYPETYEAGIATEPPAPATALEATFGQNILLRGYTLAPFGGKFRPGGTLPITLFWQSEANPSTDYRMFLHLCRDCNAPPLADVDDLPLHGYPPAGLMSTWRGYPVHDERSIKLPADLPPGTYTLLLGVYPVDNPDQEARLPISNTTAQVLGGTRLVLGTITISQ